MKALHLKQGISLVEMLAVVSMIGILAVMGAGSYNKHVQSGLQLEAKNNLALVHQSQHSYFSEEGEFNYNLQTIGARPSGQIRYDMGADWEKCDGGANDCFYTLSNNDVTGVNAACNCCNGSSPDYCCMDPTPHKSKKTADSCDTSKTPNPCYGGETASSVDTKLKEIKSTLTADKNKFDSTSFTYYAWGCVSPGDKIEKLDVWSIDHRKLLQNIKKRDD